MHASGNKGRENKTQHSAIAGSAQCDASASVLPQHGVILTAARKPIAGASPQ